MEHPAGGFDPANSTAVTARFSRGTTTVYTSYDTSCPEAGIDHGNKELIMNSCLSKGDKVFLFNNRVDADGNAGYGDANGATARATKAVLSEDEVEQSATAAEERSFSYAAFVVSERPGRPGRKTRVYTNIACS